MNVKVILYCIFTLLSTYILSSVNFNQFFKKGKIKEAKIFIILLSFIMGYLLTNFVVDFLNSSQIF